MAFIGHNIVTSTDNFGNLVRKNCLLVDKTLMIKEFLNGEEVSLITRPRRFGKTIALSMLQHFFSAEVAGQSTSGLFDNLAIAKEDNGEFVKKHQGQYPVIFISFKDLKESSFEATIRQLRDLIQKLYREHESLLQLAPKEMTVSDKTLFQKYLMGDIDEAQLQSAIAFLSEFLYKAYSKKNVVILIDEYDSPLTNAYQYRKSEPTFLNNLSDFMRNMFSAALKTNNFLEKGLMTGILRVSKNNMLSGLNNLAVYTLLGKKYAQYFGFTEEEVKELVDYTKNDVNLSDVQAFYNGYKIGDTTIYNPWSFMKFLSNHELAPYWVQTSNDSLLRDNFLTSNDDTKSKLSHLMQGESISGKIDINLRYEELIDSSDALWTLLLFCGYLTIESKQQTLMQLTCQLRIPNAEILAQYRQIFVDWFEKKLGKANYISLLSSLITGDVEAFTASLGDYLMDSLSFHDVHAKKGENFYHGFVAGLIAGIRDTHWIDSNKEGGGGRYDLICTPKDPQHPLGIVIEFKKADNVNALKNSAEAALKQIDIKAYNTVLKRYSYIHRVLKIGLAFCDKAVVSVYQHEDLSTHKSCAIVFSQMVQSSE